MNAGLATEIDEQLLNAGHCEPVVVQPEGARTVPCGTSPGGLLDAPATDVGQTTELRSRPGDVLSESLRDRRRSSGAAARTDDLAIMAIRRMA
jgi:hypothetical protein